MCALTMALNPSLIGNTPGLGVELIGTNTRHFLAVGHLCIYNAYICIYNVCIYIYICAYNGSEALLDG